MKNKSPAEKPDAIENPDLRDKVTAAKARLDERTANARPVDSVKSLIADHPVASLAAGILLGALIAKALPSSGRLRKGAAGLATVAGQFAADYASKAANAGREGLHKVEEAGSTVSEKIAEGSSDARRKAVDMAEVARSAAIEASEIAVRKVTEIASRLKH